MDSRVTVITFGVSDLPTSIKFYESGLGWTRSKSGGDEIAFFQLVNIIFALYPKELLAEDAQVKNNGSGFSGITLAHNVREKSEVALMLKKAESAGGKILKPAQDVFWGGHSGYFADPDGYLWEVAWNPHWKMNEKGLIQLAN